MPNKHLFPNRDEDFDKFLFALILYLFGTKVPDPVRPAAGPNATRLLIDAAYLDDIWQLFNLWADVFPGAVGDLTTTHPLVKTKDELRVAIENKLREIYGDIPQSKLSIEDRIATGMAARDKVVTKVPRHETAPDVDIEEVKHLHHRLRITDSGFRGNRAIANGQHINLEVPIGDADLPEDKIPFTNTHFVSDAFFELDFVAADKGKTVYYQACYENASHEKSPKSVIVSAVIM